MRNLQKKNLRCILIKNPYQHQYIANISNYAYHIQHRKLKKKV